MDRLIDVIYGWIEHLEQMCIYSRKVIEKKLSFRTITIQMSLKALKNEKSLSFY